MVFRRTIKFLKSVTVINPELGEELDNCDILIDKGRISAINPSKGNVEVNELDGSGLFAIPGLIDSHVHALGFLYEKIPGIFDLRWVMRQQRKNLSAYLRNGVTTIRDMTSALKMIRGMSLKAANLNIESPRILYAGPMFTVPEGYPYFIEKIPSILKLITGPVRIDLKVVHGENQARKIVDQVVKAGANCIKVGYQSAKYDDKQTKIPLIPISLLRVIVERAHYHKLPVAVHHVYRRDLQNLLDAPDICFDSLEHLTIDEHLSNEEINKLAKRNIPVSTTLMTYGIIDHIDRLETLLKQEPERFESKPLNFLKFSCKALRDGGEVSRYIGRKCIETGSKIMRENLKKLFNTGIKIVFGTDSGGAITPPGCPVWEFIDMMRAGMSRLDVLKSATSIAADVIGCPDLGRLKPGAIADIVLLRQNPLKDIEAVGNIAAVIRDGRLVYESNQKNRLFGNK